MKNGKAPGLDDSSSGVFKLGGEASVCWLTSILSPFEWRRLSPVTGRSSYLYQFNSDNYHGISLLSAASKVFTKIISNNLKSCVELLLRENQCGFTKATAVTTKSTHCES